ncbi:UTRA domain-containing protein [Caulobacter sp. NIBR2454]|uniref:UTRA domain-containing protein n=1 Tax=Caulobacter sp. NIBR2454 TaxID=3015996 RepID=UPI0022B75389|nr:UTRA domain-containing protein [Caulobacter sp. NIBR2454]
MSGDDSLKARIRRHILERITAGAWAAGDRIPSEHELADEFGASRMTVHHAVRDLQGDGYLTRAKGKGTFVAPARAHVMAVKLLDIADEIAARGGRHEARSVSAETRPATMAEAALFGASAGLVLFHAVVLHIEDGAPIQLEDRLVNPAIAPGIAEVDLGRETYFAHLMSRFPYPEGAAAIRALVPDTRVRELLSMADGEPCIEVERLTRLQGQVVTAVRLIYPASRYALTGEILRPTALG